MTASITKIDVEAFRNFVEASVLRVGDLPFGLHFVRGVNAANDRLGSNGAGKSTFFSDAISWCLSGRTIAGLKTTDIRSWLTDKAPRVAVTVKRGNTERVVQRGPRASALTIDGKTVGQEEVDALIGTSYAAFAQAVVWGQGQPLFFDLAPADKMGLISDALGLERWERRAEAAGSRARKLETALSALEGELRGLDAAEEHAASALASAKEAAQRWGKEHAQELAELGDRVRELRATHEKTEKKHAEEDLAVEAAALKIKLTRPAVEDVRRDVRKLEDGHRQAETTLKRLRADLAGAEKHLAAFAEKGECPTCGQTVQKRDAAKHAKELQTQIRELLKSAVAEEKSVTQFTVACDDAVNKLEDLESDLKGLEEMLRGHETALLRLARDAATTGAQLTSAADALTRAETAENPHRDAASQARQRLADVRKEIKDKEGEADRYEASIERAKFWAKGFREIRLMIVDDAVEDLRATTAEVLEALGLGEWSVDYATERETKAGTAKRALTVSIRSPAAPEGVRWEVYSGGERQRLRVAGALALSEVLLAHAGGGVDFRVFDEPTRGLSAEGVRDLCEALGAYARDAGLRVFMIDHAAIESSDFASTVVIEGSREGAAIVAAT